MTLSAGIALGDDSLRAVVSGPGGVEWTAVPAALWRSRSGGLTVGGDPAGVGAVYRDFADRVGDPVPVIGADGIARFGADLVALTAAGLLHYATRGVAPDHLVISHPAAWSRYEISVLHSALTTTWANGIPTSFVSGPLAVAAAATTAGAAREGDSLLTVDIGDRRTEVALVSGGPRRVLARSDTDDLGSVPLDRALAAHVLAQARGRFPEPDPARPAELAALRALVERCRSARVELTRQPATVVDVRLPAGTERVRVVRSEFDSLIYGPVSAGVAAIAQMLAEAARNDTRVAAVVLTGEAARTPLLAELLSARIGPDSVLPPDPEWAPARAATDIAVARARPPRTVLSGLPRPATRPRGRARAA